MIVTIPAAHPSLPGHFPGEPIVPGAVLLDFAVDCIERRFGHRVTMIAAAKFLRPVRPEQSLTFDLRRGDGGRVAVTASVAGATAFSLSAIIEG